MRFYTSLIIVILFLLSSCATFQPQYKDGKNQDSFPSDRTLVHSVYLLGDAGYADLGKQSQGVTMFGQALKNADKNSTALFLGDNIYEKGLPKKSSPERTVAEHRIQVQIDAAKDFKGRPIFIPGNHDWYSGLNGLERQEDFIKDQLGKDSFLPENGCPIEKIDITDDIVLIVVDSHWYVTNWDKHPNLNDNCEFKTRARFIDEFESLIKKARGKTTIVAIHHPMFSNGPHGGQYSFGSHMSPLPVLGSLKNVIRRTGGVVNVDIQNKRYTELKDHLVTLAQENEKTIFVSGHEHTLQYLVEANIPQIVSGSGSKISATKNTGSGVFSYGAQGYARLDVFDDGSTWVRFYADENPEPVFQTEVHPADSRSIPNYKTDFPEQMTASIYSKEETDKSKGYKKLWGERYREYFSTDVTIPTVNLDTLYGGLKPVRKGGGHQSKSLRFEDPEGREYVMRALRKNAVQYIQAVVFADQYVTPDLEGTKTEALLLDGFTASHPYAPFTISELSKAVGVFYTEPRLFYVPKQSAIGKFNNDFGDEIYMIEERAADGHGDKEGFGFSDKLISTYDMLEEIRQDRDHVIDEEAYIRARLFDMVIGDWDRHQDQWRWAVFKEEGKTIYRPVPRDRDQAFSLMDDGTLMGIATFLAPPIRLLRSFEAELKDPKWFNVEPFPLDVALLTQSSKSDWDKQVKRIQDDLTDAVIDKAFLKFPKEVQDETIDVIRSKLIGRRGNLKIISDEYYKIVNKYATVRGTDQDDWFEIERLTNGSTSVKVYSIRQGERNEMFFNRTFSPEENKEIWIFGLDDDDYFEVKGSGSGRIVVRLIGGQNEDTYNVLNGKGVHIYDYRSKKSNFETNRGKRHLKDDYFTNIYDYKKIKYNSSLILPSIGANPDDGFRIGLAAQFIKNGYDGEKFTAKHQLGAQYYFATSGFDLRYNGEFKEVFNNINLGLTATFTSPNFATNFFGYGNSTPNLNTDPVDEEEDLDYNRVKQSTYSISPSLIRNGEYGSRFSVGLTYESIEIENTEGRFINEYLGNSDDRDRDEFVGFDVNYSFDNSDNDAFPTLGMNFDLLFGYRDNLNNDRGFSYFIPSMAFDYKLVPSGRIVLGTKVWSQFNFGDEFEFYQAATIGGNNGLRGYRNERFSGKRAFYHNTDIRFNLRRFRTSVIPVELGIYGSFDYGRIWVDNELVTNTAFNENALNTSFGGGVFFNMIDTIAANFGLFNSDDGLRFAFSFGFGL
ncbi:MAG: phosphoesterase [Flavobacteriaceae bacterium]|nr:phosphoesterase [Flavobacteriaceae bacterium]